MGAIRNLSRTLVLCGAVLLLAASAQATPLGLEVGDVITQFEWDSLQSEPGDGADWDLSAGIFHSDGRVTSVQLQAAPFTRTQSNVDMRFDLGLQSHNLFFTNPPTNTLVFANAIMPGSVTPHFVMQENGVNILWGNFTAGLLLEGNFDITDESPQPLLARGRITLTGGDANLREALGGAVNVAGTLLLSASVFGFNAPLANLAADGNIFNSDFTVSLSGTLIPISASAFVPEPTTALLLGAGLLGLLAIGRRRTR